MIDVQAYEKRLRERLADLDARLHQIEEDLSATPNPDAEERASEREADEALEDLGAAGLTEMRAIRAALKRIEEGEYGYCVNCGEAIAPERLDALPHAARCRKCAA